MPKTPCPHQTASQVAVLDGGPLFQCANPACYALLHQDGTPYVKPHTHADGDVGPHSHPGYPHHAH